MEVKIFRLSMVTSVLLHSLLLGSFFYANIYYSKSVPKIVEVVYQHEMEAAEPDKKPGQEIKTFKDAPVPPDPKIMKFDDPARVALPNSPELKLPVRMDEEKKFPVKLPVSETKRQIVVPLLTAEKISNPNYINYRDSIRNRIKSRANFFVDDPSFQSGDVYLTFVLKSDGTIKGVKIIDDKTYASAFLRSVSLRSIQESNPFPPFPRELKYPELSFNVLISFVVDEKAAR